MPRKKLVIPPPVHETTRRDTIGLRSIVTYDPHALRPTTPVLIGEFVVNRRPLPDSIYTLYEIMDGPDIVRTQISHPDESDCRSAVNAHRMRQSATMAVHVIRKAKKRRASKQRAEVAA